MKGFVESIFIGSVLIAVLVGYVDMTDWVFWVVLAIIVVLQGVYNWRRMK